MNEHKARVNLEGMIMSDNALSLNWARYVYWPGNDTIRIEGTFTTDELEAIAWWVKNKEVK